MNSEDTSHVSESATPYNSRAFGKKCRETGKDLIQNVIHSVMDMLTSWKMYYIVSQVRDMSAVTTKRSQSVRKTLYQCKNKLYAAYL